MEEKKRRLFLRYLAIVSLFCVVCVIYLGRLFYIQIAGRENTYDDDTTTRTVTVQAVRGEIYDRNGVKLVENRYTYDLALSWGSFSALDITQKNQMLLRLEKALSDCDAKDLYVQPYFPFDGQYPYYSFSEEAKDPEHVKNFRLTRVLSRIGLDEDATEKDLARYYVTRYELLYTDSEGMRRYNDNQIDSLIRFYYDMDAKAFYANGEYTVVEEIDLKSSSAVNLMTYVKEQNLSAVRFNGNVERVYLYPGIASHILGSVGPIYAEEWDYYDERGYQMNAIVGKDGCESAFEEYLHGINGELKIKEDANGNVISTETVREPVAGNDIRLTIDIKLQIAAEEGLKNNVLAVAATNGGADCDSGAAVAIDPETFEVLAIASYPTYNLVTFNQDYAALKADPAEPLRNRAMNETYAPGSTLKLGMALIGLMEGEATADENIICNGRYHSNGPKCSTYGTNHAGAQNLFEAISHSCNTYFCELGDRLGIRTMETYLSRLGLGKSTGFELGGASGILAGPTYRGEIQSEEEWKDGMTWQAAIGQSDNRMSPLQLATYTATICNGGTRYNARILHGVYRFGSSEPIEVGVSEVLDKTDIPERTQSTIRSAMQGMVTDEDNRVVYRNLGAAALSQKGVTVGGKTGTAEVGGSAPDNALFVCEAISSSQQPDIVISVILEAGVHGYYASQTAGAILAEFYNAE